jgi:hypothetical protein
VIDVHRQYSEQAESLLSWRQFCSRIDPRRGWAAG